MTLATAQVLAEIWMIAGNRFDVLAPATDRAVIRSIRATVRALDAIEDSEPVSPNELREILRISRWLPSDGSWEVWNS